MSVSVCIASRGRPQLLRNTVTTLLGGKALADTVIAVALDSDDPDLPLYNPALPEGCRVSVAPREDSLGAKWNRAQGLVKADLYVLWPDDTVMPETGWDATLEAAAATLPDKTGAVFFGSIPGVLQPGIAMTAKFVEAMGFFCPPYFPSSWFADTWCLELATMSGRAVHADVRVSLLQDLKGASRGVRNVLFWARFFDATRVDRIRTAERIIRAGTEPAERKAELLSQIGAWAARWEQSNAVLRDPARAAELEKYYSFDAPSDSRDMRLKLAADALLCERAV